jgi:hypothetical protein
MVLLQYICICTYIHTSLVILSSRLFSHSCQRGCDVGGIWGVGVGVGVGVGGGSIMGGGRGCEMHVSHTCHNIC